jgi:hypothetical protein
MECGEVDRNVNSKAVGHPPGHAVDLGAAVVEARDQQRRDLEPDAGLALQVLERVQHRAKVRGTRVVIKLLREPLEIDVGGVHVPVELRPRLGADVAGGDGHGFHSDVVTGLRHVDRILVKNHRIVVGERHAATPVRRRRAGDVLRQGRRGQRVDLA